MPFTIRINSDVRALLRRFGLQPDERPPRPDLLLRWSDGAPRVTWSRSVPGRLPVFARVGPAVDDALGQSLVTAIRGRPFEVTHAGDGSVRLAGGDEEFEAHGRTGRFLFASRSRLFGREDAVDRRPVGRAVESARALLGALNARIGYRASPALRRMIENIGGTFLETLDVETGALTRARLNTRIHFGERLRLASAPDLGELPVMLADGPTMTFDPDGDLVGFRGSLHRIGRNLGALPIRSAAAVAELVRREARVRLASLAIQLIYTPTLRDDGVARLEPAWLVQAQDDRGHGRSTPLRAVVVLAVADGALPPSAWGVMAFHRDGPAKPPPTVSALAAGAKYKAGTEWVKALGGLTYAAENAAGFIAGLPTASWQTIFQRGDGDAKLDDWQEDDDKLVDEADVAFYAGHADAYGWMLGDGWTDSSVLAADPAKDFWGNTNLGWLAIAGCGPLQGTSAGTTTSATTRWRSVFDGLRGLYGFTTDSVDVPNEGSTFAARAATGMSLVDAWLDAGITTQPSTLFGAPVEVAALYATFDGGSTLSDRLPGVAGAPGSAPVVAKKIRMKSTTC